ncbi:MAG: hypoxanthine phosphoribosyltransferase [Oscillospiraceae bacterium]|nr:hypoxanthine phosphoribosyltransferase [Oscillospiraceae bacterium]
MREDLETIFASEEQLQERIRALGAQITRDYQGKTPLFVGVLKGCFIFMADLVRACNVKCTVDFMVVSSYGDGTTSTGAVKIVKDLSENVEGRDIIIVEDILDSGNTLSYLKRYMEARKPASIRIVTLTDKPDRRTADVTADYVGFEIPDAFVVGYGLDYQQQYRNLPYIGVLKPEIYS